MKPKKLWPSLCAGALVLGGPAPAQTVGSDSWAATDALGRKVRDYKEAGAKKSDKFVAMFYWTWHQGNDDTTYRVKNITEIVRQHPEAMKDYHHPAWGTKQPGFFFWEQPLLGYYKTTDPWVLRKHAEMLADAGVDAVFFDCTNGSLTWQDSYEALLKTWDQAQKDGVNVPKIAFMLPFGPAPHSLVSLRQLYNDLYKPGRYENLWFVWKGKPCIMAYPDNLTDSPTDRAIADFFTFRPGQPDYVDGPTRNDQWGWLEVYPQHGYVKSPDGDFEQVAVGIAQNTSPDRKGHCGAFNVKDAYGRNFSVRNGFDPRVDGYLYGWNFDEQWERAYELDPELVFVTGWNGYDVIVNRLSPDGRKAIVERNVGGRWEWEKAGEAAMAVSGDKLELSIARSILGLTDDQVDIEFKWNDNMQENGNIMDFYVNGDTAPGGRFNFVYSTL